MDTPDPSTQLEVTLRHSSFGEFAFRCEPDQLGSVAQDMLAEAHASHERKSAIAALDEQQAQVVKDMAAADQRVAAAQLLGDPSQIKAETAAREALDTKVDAIARQRAALI